jgi:TonB family protein
MPATEIPPRHPSSPRSAERHDAAPDLYDGQRWEAVYRDMHSIPALLVQMQDDLSRSRRREAFWISVVFHLVIGMLILNWATVERWFPAARRLTIASRSDLLKQKDLTYVEMPPDLQKVTKRPNTNNMSDKDRVASSRTPQPKDLQKVLNSMRPNPPGPTAPRTQQPQAQAPPAPPADNPSPAPPPPDQSQAALHLPATENPRPSFETKSMSAESAVEQAARAAMSSNGGYGGGGGDYGLGQGKKANSAVGELDVLSDTMGVDFGPYLNRVLHDVRMNWYNLIPEAARAPLMKRGKVSIEFAITKNGGVAGMKIVGPSGDISLDRAAWGGITASNPFPPLPNEFRGQYLALRFHFFYNPEGSDLH